MLTYSMQEWDTPYAKEFGLITLQVLKSLLKLVFNTITQLMIEDTKGKSKIAGVTAKAVVGALAGAAVSGPAGALTAGGTALVASLR